VRSLVREAAKWLRECKDTDQWAKPWPDRTGQKRRMLDDIAHGRTWLLRDGTTVAGTITIDPGETLGAQGQPIWPAHKRHELALYVRRVVISRRYAGLGLGAALLDWASDVAKRDYGAMLIRVEVWTTNAGLHAYYCGQSFTPCKGRDPSELDDYPSQALFERDVGQAGSDYTKLFTEAEAPYQRKPRWRIGN
jgi:GNAT superfamily N-acetyltransferase